MSRRQFPDQIAVYNRPTDVHPYDNSEEEYQRFMNDFHGDGKLGEGECYRHSLRHLGAKGLDESMGGRPLCLLRYKGSRIDSGRCLQDT